MGRIVQALLMGDCRVAQLAFMINNARGQASVAVSLPNGRNLTALIALFAFNWAVADGSVYNQVPLYTHEQHQKVLITRVHTHLIEQVRM